MIPTIRGPAIPIARPSAWLFRQVEPGHRFCVLAMEFQRAFSLMSPHSPPADVSFLTGGGKMTALMKEYDWAKSPVRAPKSWSPPRSRTVISKRAWRSSPSPLPWPCSATRSVECWKPDQAFAFSSVFSKADTNRLETRNCNASRNESDLTRPKPASKPACAFAHSASVSASLARP